MGIPRSTACRNHYLRFAGRISQAAGRKTMPHGPVGYISHCSRQSAVSESKKNAGRGLCESSPMAMRSSFIEKKAAA